MDIFQTVTNRILTQLEAGVVPWRKTWTAGLPKSLTTAREYRGVNLLMLGASGYTSRYWVTYREALRSGGHVRKGERATAVVYWKWRTPEELAKLREQTGRTDWARCVPFTSAVFNLDQVDGVERPQDDVPRNDNNRFDTAEKMLEVMPDRPEVVHGASLEPAYSPRLDRVILPHLSQFESGAEYYGTLFHELVHATGHRRRLNRFAEVEGDRFERYSIEELVAEFAAAFLCAFTGLASQRLDDLQTSYIEGWSRALRKDHRLVIRAASAAQRACDYVRGKVVGQDAADTVPTGTPGCGVGGGQENQTPAPAAEVVHG